MEFLQNQITKTVTIFFILANIFGYFFLLSYYSYFDISIEYYIEINDILLTATKLFLKIIFPLICAELIFFLLKTSTLKVLQLIKKKSYFHESKKHIEQNIMAEEIVLMLLVLSFPVLLFYISKIEHLFYFYFCFFFYKSAVFSEKVTADKNKIFLISASIIIAIFLSLTLAQEKALSTVRDNKLIADLEFYIDNVCFSTLDINKVYIGETSKYYFIYDKLNVETLIFQKDQLQNIKFIDSHRDSAKLKIIKNFLVDSILD